MVKYLVIKNVAYFPTQCALNSGPVMDAVLGYLKSRGIQCQQDSWDSDAVIVWSVLWNGRLADNEQVYHHYRSHGRPVIVIDVGSLKRGTTWKLAVNNITAEGYYGHLHNLDWDRPKKLGILQKINFASDPSILICAQHNRSLQVAALLSMEDWILKQIGVIRSLSDRHIRIRPHPRSWLNLNDLGPNISVETPRPIKGTYDSYDMQFNCHALVNYNSGPSIQAALAGVRLFTDSTSLAFPMSTQWDKLECPYMVNRESWLVEICHTEYTVEELAQGIWLDRIAPALIASTVDA